MFTRKSIWNVTHSARNVHKQKFHHFFKFFYASEKNLLIMWIQMSVQQHSLLKIFQTIRLTFGVSCLRFLSNKSHIRDSEVRQHPLGTLLQKIVQLWQMAFLVTEIEWVWTASNVSSTFGNNCDCIGKNSVFTRRHFCFGQANSS